MLFPYDLLHWCYLRMSLVVVCLMHLKLLRANDSIVDNPIKKIISVNHLRHLYMVVLLLNKCIIVIVKLRSNLWWITSQISLVARVKHSKDRGFRLVHIGCWVEAPVNIFSNLCFREISTMADFVKFADCLNRVNNLFTEAESLILGQLADHHIICVLKHTVLVDKLESETVISSLEDMSALLLFLLDEKVESLK